MLANNSEVLAFMQHTLQQINDCLTTVCTDVEDLKHTHSPGGHGAQLPDGCQPVMLPNNMMPSFVSMPDNLVGSEDDDNFAPHLIWEPIFVLSSSPVRGAAAILSREGCGALDTTENSLSGSR